LRFLLGALSPNPVETRGQSASSLFSVCRYREGVVAIEPSASAIVAETNIVMTYDESRKIMLSLTTGVKEQLTRTNYDQCQ
jgi:hypothetical protein